FLVSIFISVSKQKGFKPKSKSTSISSITTLPLIVLFIIKYHAQNRYQVFCIFFCENILEIASIPVTII
ncbi:hypothetical protein, partial [Klebsiella pneumoniae]|uniref:hypothetical protein n=1 Tax=Klebsiella pneumoniae TaxID=573 RepID=UPI001C70AF74